MRFLKVVPALKVKMSVWGVQVGPYGFSAVRVSLVLSGHGQASRSSCSLVLCFSCTHTTQLGQGQWPAVLKQLSSGPTLIQWTQRQAILITCNTEKSIERPHQRIDRKSVV